MSLLTLLQDAAVKAGMPRPVSIVGSNDPNAPLLLSLANQEGSELARRHDWQVLIVQHIFTTTASEEQPSALPADYDRLVYGAEVWDRSINQKLTGPTSPAQWMELKSAPGAGVTGWWRMIGGKLNIFPAPAAGKVCALEYVSSNWAQSALSAPQTQFLADGDTAKISERLITLGVAWRWKRAKGFDYAEEMATYERELERAASRDGGIGVLRPTRWRESDAGWATWPGVITP